MSAASEFRAGDLVFVGPPGPLDRKVTWKVLAIRQASDDIYYATLASGQTERLRTVPVSKLTRFRVMEGA